MKVKWTTTMYDIRPVDETGRVGVAKMMVQPVVRLVKSVQKPTEKVPTDATSTGLMNSAGATHSTFPANHLASSLSYSALMSNEEDVDNQKPRSGEVVGSVEDRGFAPLDSQVVNRGQHYASPTVSKSYQSKNIKSINHAEELEKYLNEDTDPVVELAAAGAEIHQRPTTNDQRPTINDQQQDNSIKVQEFKDLKDEPDYRAILAQVNQKIPRRYDDEFIGEAKPVNNLRLTTDNQRQATEELKRADYDLGMRILTKVDQNVNIKNQNDNLEIKKAEGERDLKLKILKVGYKLPVIAIAVTSLAAFGGYGLSMKNNLISQSNSAVQNLQSAGENIKNGDFNLASGNFAQAAQEFKKADSGLNFFVSGIGSLTGGGGKIKSAQNLIKAGQLMAEAGKVMSESVAKLAKANLAQSLITDNIPRSNLSTDSRFDLEMFKDLNSALKLSQKNLKKAKALLADINISAIPEDKRAGFDEFNTKLPEFEKLINDSVDYSQFLEDLIGVEGEKKYLVLFQNPSELRPTGGFPGSYGVLTFRDGKLADFYVDDVYNIDGQLKELYVPPVPLQHITPNWGMRDANWFVDFPTSAQKAASFFEKETGYSVDGVITFSPNILSRILDIIGPIEMPEYGLTLNSDNLLATLQEEVEYKGDRTQPKKIIVDLAPKIIEKLYSTDSGKWLDVFNTVVMSMERKDILMYFKDLSLESFSVEKGFSGQVELTNSDYLMVNISNIKGSKSDLVTDTSLDDQVSIEDGYVRHKLSITRKHNGGGNHYGFYNKKNPAYVRVLVPDGAELAGISGNSRPDYQPLLNYAKTDFKKDKDLERLEDESQTDETSGVTKYKESGKTEFGFWMIVGPGETKTVKIEYTVPMQDDGSYQLYVQKQPGLEVKNIKFSVNGEVHFDGMLEKDIMLR